ncbi:hypothetical protein GOBAR_AA31768 [Gossypium barbadense]|uniref:Uncharacterized protein n=1 Tax=Gossypium barbadense TaxID=3634 RepID=A0A2P5WCV5_GOSBA|nr:hypothetical protein GOBAR_AA31768 [Gossypium barbadense]
MVYSIYNHAQGFIQGRIRGVRRSQPSNPGHNKSTDGNRYPFKRLLKEQELASIKLEQTLCTFILRGQILLAKVKTFCHFYNLQHRIGKTMDQLQSPTILSLELTKLLIHQFASLKEERWKTPPNFPEYPTITENMESVLS